MKYKISFKSYGVMGTNKGQYSRIGYIYIPKLFGGISIPIPIVKFRRFD